MRIGGGINKYLGDGFVAYWMGGAATQGEENLMAPVVNFVFRIGKKTLPARRADLRERGCGHSARRGSGEPRGYREIFN